MSENSASNEVLDTKTIDHLKAIGEGDNAGFLQELIELYLHHSPLLIERIKNAAAEWEPEEIEKAAHRLKGSSLNMGALAVAETARALEKKGRENDTGNVDTMVSHLEQQFAAVEKALKSMG